MTNVPTNVTIDEVPPIWDAEMDSIVGAAPDGSFTVVNPKFGERLPGRLWHAVDSDRAQVVGFARLTCDEDGAELSIAVAAPYRRLGIGSQLLERVRREAEKHHKALRAKIRSSNGNIETVLDWLVREGFVVQTAEGSREQALLLARHAKFPIDLELSLV
jgi:GNAT superfamily N-acetyltransferase